MNITGGNMKKTFISLFAFLLIIVTLSGCNIPGIIQDEDEDEDNYYYTEKSSENLEANDNTLQYRWLVHPMIRATNIISFDGSQIDPSISNNDSYKNYSVILIDGKYGIIDYEGQKTVSPEYDNFYLCTCGEIVLYNVDADGNRQYCCLDKKGKIKNNISKHDNNLPTYYWDSISEKTYIKTADNNYLSEYGDKKPVVALDTEVTSLGDGNFAASQQANPRYGIVKNNEVRLDFEYESYYAPSFATTDKTIFALKKDGKWGYFNVKGKKIIPAIANEIFSSDCGEVIDSSGNPHPYLYSDDYLTISTDTGCCYYDPDGNCVIPAGEFEQARPVHNGRAWVKQDGYWRVIQIGEIVEEESSNLGFKKNTTTKAIKSNKQSTTKSDSSSDSSSKETSTTKTTKKPATTKKTAAKPVVKTTKAPVKTTPKPTVTKPTQTNRPQTTQPPATTAATTAATTPTTVQTPLPATPTQPPATAALIVQTEPIAAP